MEDYNIREMRPPKYKEGLIDLIDYVNMSNMSIVEIGSYTGESTVTFANHPSVKTVYAIDPWENGYDDNDVASYERSMTLVESKFDDRIVSFDNIIKIKERSDSAINYFTENNIRVDLVYIDGIHTYHGVMSDLVNYSNIIYDTGFISGHDVKMSDVKRALIDFHKKEPDMTFKDNSWVYKI